MAHDREFLIGWLNDAYAMEQAQLPVLENHAKDARSHPHIQQRDEQHITETRHHADMVRDCLRRLGEEPSRAKSMLGSVFGNVQSVMTSAADDEIIKNCLMDYASENLEIASYSALVTAARELGETEIANTCERILDDERRMAHWLEDNLPNTVRQTLRR